MPSTHTTTTTTMLARARRVAIAAFAGAAVLLGVGVVPANAAADTPLEIILERTNDYRASKGKSGLRLNSDINAIAQSWSNYMLAKNKLAHNPDYADKMPSGWSRIGENVGYACGYGGAAAAAKVIMNGWLNSSGHEANIRGDYTDIGIGFAYRSSDDCAFATQDFGKYANSPSTVSVLGKVAPPSGQSYSTLSGATVVVSGGGVTRSASVSPQTGEYVVTDIPSGTYTLHVRPASSQQTTEYFTDAAGSRCANRITLRNGDWTDVDVKLTTGSLTSPSKSLELCDVSANKDSSNYAGNAAEIGWLADAGITKGFPNGYGAYEYRAGETVTRGAMAAFLYRYAGEPAFTPPSKSPFSDMTPTSTFYKEVTWLWSQGITNGYVMGDGKVEFRPKGSVIRAHMAAFLYRMAGEPAFSPPKSSPFEDVSPGWALYREVTWLADQEITKGYTLSNGDVEFRSGVKTSRGQMAIFLKRFDSALR